MVLTNIHENNIDHDCLLGAIITNTGLTFHPNMIKKRKHHMASSGGRLIFLGTVRLTNSGIGK